MIRLAWLRILFGTLTGPTGATPESAENLYGPDAESHGAITSGDKARLSGLRSALRVLLKPHHEDDLAIVESVKINAYGADGQAEEFSQRISLLLKHDWERAKREAKSFPFRGRKPKRMPFEEYRRSISR